jgi:hypothetical protein
MADWKGFLENTKDYPDTTTVKIGDTEVPLGSIRALNASERDSLAAAVKANQEQKAVLDQRQAQVMDFATKTQQAYDAVQKAASTAANQPANAAGGVDPWADPWLVPVKSALDSRDKTIGELTGQLKNLATIVQNAASIWSEDRWDREYSGIDFGKRDKKPSREELLKFATENKLFDRHSIPSVRAAWEKMSEQDRLEELRKSEFEKGREAGRMDAMAARIPPPGVPGAGAPAAAPLKPPPGELGDLYSEAIKDPELRAMIEQLPSGLV